MILFELLIAGGDSDLASSADSLGKTPADLASDLQLVNCERALRQFAYAKRTGALQNLSASSPTSFANQSEPEERPAKTTTSHRKPRAASAQVRLAVREKSFASLAESELTSKSSFRYSDVHAASSSGYYTEEDLIASVEKLSKTPTSFDDTELQSPTQQDSMPVEGLLKTGGHLSFRHFKNISKDEEEYQKVQIEHQKRLQHLQEKLEQQQKQKHSQHSMTSATEKREKRVKFQKRIKSAPNVDSNQSKDNKNKLRTRQTESHQLCKKSKPFLAYRSVPEEELRPLAVEYVELPRQASVGLAQKERERRVMGLMREQTQSESSASPHAQSPRMPPRELSFLEDESCIPNTGFSMRSRTDITSASHLPQRATGLKSASMNMTEHTRGTSAWSMASQASLKPPPKPQLDRQALVERKRMAFRKYSDPSNFSRRMSEAGNYYKASYHKRREEEIRRERIPPPR